MYNSRIFYVIILDSGFTRHMFAHKCYFNNMRPAKDIVIRVADGREVPALGVGNVGFLKDCLWVPMLRKDLISESQLTTEDHLGINREPDSPEAIVYRGSIFGEYKVILRAYIKDLSNRLYEVNPSYFWNRQTRSPVTSHCDEQIPSPLSSYDSNNNMFNLSRQWEDELLDDEEWMGDDELALYGSSNDTEQGPPFTNTRQRLGMSYHTSVFKRPPPETCVCSECNRKFYYTIPSALVEGCVAYVSKSKALQILHQSVGHITPERLQHLVASGQWSWSILLSQLTL